MRQKIFDARRLTMRTRLHSTVPGHILCGMAVLGCALAGMLAIGATKSPTGPASKAVDFDREIRPILAENCFKCHGPDDEARKAKLRFDLQAEARKPAKSGRIPIVPGAPERSELINRITTTDTDDVMPPVKTGKKL